jgi:hypothetical protein
VSPVFVTEETERGKHWIGRGLSEPAQGCTAHRVPNFIELFELGRVASSFGYLGQNV